MEHLNFDSIMLTFCFWGYELFNTLFMGITSLTNQFEIYTYLPLIF